MSIRHKAIPLLGLFALITADAAAPPMPNDPAHQLFETADKCMACHNGLITPSGEDVSIGAVWRTSIMAHASRDPYWQAAVRREILDHPQARARIEDECSACHMPMTRFLAKTAGEEGEIFAHLPFSTPQTPMARLAREGVSCTLCHQIEAANLGERESFTAGFRVDTARPLDRRAIFGPFEVDAGRQTVMSSASGFEPREGGHIRGSALCATCHTLYTHALGPQGQVIGELPEQVPYLEWLHSDYPGRQSCQACHMPALEQDMAITAVLGQPREGLSRHVFRGGNFFMQRMLNRYRDELSVDAPAQALDAAARRTVDHLQTDAARIALERVAVDRRGLLSAIRFIKDNRLLPHGFVKPTAPHDIAVQGEAAGDPDFTGGGDRVLYRIDVSGAEGPFHVEAALWYQSIAYRWAHNLARYDAFETQRFVRFYESMAEASAVVLARARAASG